MKEVTLREKVKNALEYLKTEGITSAEVGIILGTGLGDLIKEIQTEKIVEYSTIPHFPEATVETHAGKLVFGKISGRSVLVMQGRFHYYEGYSMKEITFPVYVMKAIGIKCLLISNASGNLNLKWKKGELMLINDHINLLPENPLRGINDDFFGPRFPDMSCPYNKKLAELTLDLASHLQIVLREGIYVSVEGPNLETKAEYRYLRSIGADAVGMSTVPEVIAANYLGIPVCAVSVLTDDCDPENLKPVDIMDIINTAKMAEVKLTLLFKSLIGKL